MNDNDQAKKYRVTDGRRIWYADKVDYDQHTGILTVDGLSTFVHNPKKLQVAPADEFRARPYNVTEAARLGAIEI